MHTRRLPSQDRLPLEREVRVRTKDDQLSAASPLSEYRDLQAWVLLADPGAGKSDVFASLSRLEDGNCVSARDFVDLDLPTGWHGPLFIDALDEIASGHATGSTPLAQIRRKLQILCIPKFRISCREADWRGNADAEALKRLVGDGNFAELHLTALTHAQSMALISHWQPRTEAQAETFMQEAKNHDLEGLLDNPQTLRLLVKAISATGNQWPDSKTKTYEMACAQLVREHNDEHLANSHDNTPLDELTLKAAAYLCAVMLLSASGSIALQRQSQTGPGAMSLPELKSADSAPDLNACRVALHTRLFRGSSRSGEFVPVHRTVAEYLGACYLAKRIDAGLPAGRVLALMLGQDGGLVPELRGLHAWLAAVVPSDLRRELILHDPLGVVINGDVRAFSRADKLAVLGALQHEANRDVSFRRQNWTRHPFGALATPDMANDFLILLQSDDRSPAHQALLDCVLDALLHGQPMFELAPALEKFARDKTYQPSLRNAAVAVLVSFAEHANLWPRLLQLLAEVQDQLVEDPDDQILGCLLKALYPDHIPAARLWQYFKKPKVGNLLGSYWSFWHKLPKNTPIEALPALLDGLIANDYQSSGSHDPLNSNAVVGQLLVDGVTHHGEHLDTGRLYNWLSLGLSVHHSCALEDDHKTTLQQWLGTHPAIYKELFEYGLTTSRSAEENAVIHVWKVEEHLYRAPAVADAKAWYLSLAEGIADDELRRELLFKAFRSCEQGEGPNSAIALLEHWAALHAKDANWVETQLCQPYPPPDPEQHHIDAELLRKARKAEEERQKKGFFAKMLPCFETGPAHLGLLALIGETYLNFFGRSGLTSPKERLLELLDQNPAWVELALQGLRQCLARPDLPTAADIVGLNLKGRMYNLAAPCLAAMALRDSEGPATALDLDRSTLAAVAAFHLTSHTNQDASWFKRLVAQKPGIVAGLMQTLISRQLAARKEHVDGLHALAFDPDYATIARLIIPELLVRMPARIHAKQLGNLRFLVIALVKRLDRDAQRQLIAAKLSIAGMDVAQKAYWLTAGLLLEPKTYLEHIKAFVRKTQKRSSHVFSLIHDLRERGGTEADLPAQAQHFLIALLGPQASPAWARGSGIVTMEAEIGCYVEGLIAALAGNPDHEATQSLLELQSSHDMKPWADTLNRALFDQRIARRKALFRPATVNQVCNTLANLQPTSAADLWALTVDHLTQLANEIRNGSTNDYRQYWANDTPKLEEDCRDTLLSDLKQRLATLGVAAEREGNYANDKRADIKVIGSPHHIPIEIKRETHPDLWKAIAGQLIAKYGRESASDGYGIYLVFWFTGQLKAAPTDGGNRPKTPQELQRRLAAVMPEMLKHKIAVLVVDCAKPLPTKPAERINFQPLSIQLGQ